MSASYWRNEYSKEIDSAWRLDRHYSANRPEELTSLTKSMLFQKQWLRNYDSKDKSLHQILAEYIFCLWGISSVEMNISFLTELGKKNNKTFKEMINLVNKHIYFRNQRLVNNQINHFNWLRQHSKDLIAGKYNSTTNKSKDIWSKLLRKHGTFLTLSSYSDQDQELIWAMADEEVYNPQFNTAGYIELEKNLQPIEESVLQHPLIKGTIYKLSWILLELWEGEMFQLLQEFNSPPEFIEENCYSVDNYTDYSSWEIFIRQRYFSLKLSDDEKAVAIMEREEREEEGYSY